MLKDTLRKVVLQQREELRIGEGVTRAQLDEIDRETRHAVVISGIRRCGKSTLLRQLMQRLDGFYFFNFEDPKALEFTVEDFAKLDEALHEEFGDADTYLLDEVQNVERWESWVRSMQDKDKKFYITGSNASLLSRELGTKLTGRHLTYELYPFSYEEYLRFTKQDAGVESWEEYMRKGGFPEHLEYGKPEVLQELFRDILSRDIAVRHGIREEKTLTQMARYLLTNTGKEFSYNKLKAYFELGSVNTVISYVSYFEDSYLLFTIPKYDASYKKQVINPKKVYSIDVGLSNAVSASFSEDAGRVLENLVFLHLQRTHEDVYYYHDEKECDFIATDGERTRAVQACYELHEDNKERELDGLRAAMNAIGLDEGVIVTVRQEDTLGDVRVVPAWKWVLD